MIPVTAGGVVEQGGGEHYIQGFYISGRIYRILGALFTNWGGDECVHSDMSSRKNYKDKAKEVL